ncbi:MAG: rhodanese-like domain-containing protein [Bacteroidales bacterium]|nr:rhodanese-like domain-containing protein [Bacteroidales bacterium]
MMKNRNKLIPIIICSAVLFFSCNGIYENGSELSKDVNNYIPQISVNELKTKIDSNQEFLLIDVRQAVEYESGNIEGSMLLPRGNLEFLISDSLFWEEQFMYAPEKDDEIIIYSQKGERAALAVQSLINLSFKNVKNLTGGYSAYDPNHKAEPVKKESGACGD